MAKDKSLSPLNQTRTSVVFSDYSTKGSIRLNMLYHSTSPSYKNKACFQGLRSACVPVLLLFGLLLLFPSTPATAQVKATEDTVMVKPHSPTKAAIYSTVLPGLGQGYNKKYWKIPIIYAGFGVIIYFIVTNTKEYKQYEEAYYYVASGDSGYIDNEYVYKYDEQQLLDGKNYYRRNMELSYIIGGLWYILNIIDASVDAHFFDYDISDDLTIRVDPVMLNRRDDYRPVTGLKLTLKF